MLGKDELEVILTIVESGNFSNAARTLYIGQPTIVKNIQKIERELGFKIFIRNRGKKKIEITKKGEEFITIARKLYKLYQEALDIKYFDKIKINIASSDGPYLTILNNLVLNILKNSKNYIFKLKLTTYRDSIEALRDNIVDIAFLGNNIYNSDIKIKKLFSEDYVLISKKGMLMSNDLKRLKIEDCVYSSYSSEFSLWFKDYFDNNKPIIQCDLIEQVILFIDNLTMWSIVPKSVANYISKNIEIDIFKINEDIPKRYLYYARRIDDKNESIDEFLTLIKKSLDEYN